MAYTPITLLSRQVEASGFVSGGAVTGSHGYFDNAYINAPVDYGYHLLTAGNIYFSGQTTLDGVVQITGSAALVLDYDALSKTDPGVKGWVWIDTASGNMLKVSVG
jgi:hypothetical protein